MLSSEIQTGIPVLEHLLPIWVNISRQPGRVIEATSIRKLLQVAKEIFRDQLEDDQEEEKKLHAPQRQYSVPKQQPQCVYPI